MTITLTENPKLVEHYLNELSTDVDSSCQEMRSLVLHPLRNCIRLLQPFQVTQRGRDILATLHQIIEHTERMIIHWEAESNEIAKTLRGERKYRLPEEPVAIG